MKTRCLSVARLTLALLLLAASRQGIRGQAGTRGDGYASAASVVGVPAAPAARAQRGREPCCLV